jgi:Tol biopolymer transport system component
VDLGEPTRYARGIYSIALDGSGPALLVDRAGAVVGTAAWNPLYQTYSATPDGTAVAFVAGQQSPPGQAELYLLTPVGSGEPRLLATFNEIWNLAIAPQGDRVAVRGARGEAETSLYLVDTLDGAVTPVQLTFRWPGEPMWSPDGEWLALVGSTTEEEPPGIYILRSDGSGLKRLADGGPPMAWSPDGSRIAFAIGRWREGAGLYTTDLEGHVTKISETLAPQYGIPSLAWSSDGRCIVFVAWAEEGEESPIRALDVETGWEVSLTTNAMHPTWSPDGRHIAFLRDGNLWTMNVDGSQQTRLTNPRQPFVQEPLWLPDGSGLLFAFVPPMTGSVYVANPDGTGEVNLADGSGAVWSPDGTKIAFRGGGSGPALGVADQIYVMNRDGTGVHKIGESVQSDAIKSCMSWRPYAWSPDGQRIAFVKNESAGGGDVYVINVDGSGERKLMGVGPTNTLPLAWSPDGSRLAVATGGLFVIDPATGEKRKLSDNAPYPPVWSPDGAQLAFTFWDHARPSEPASVYVVNADGSGQPRKLTDGSSPAWSPDGLSIAFAR